LYAAYGGLEWINRRWTKTKSTSLNYWRKKQRIIKMAKFIVPPRKRKDEYLVKCYSCGCLYMPEFRQKERLTDGNFEPCPSCGYKHNTEGNCISLWKYNIIKFFRGGFDKESEE